MHSDTHLTLQRLRSTELHRQADEFRMARTVRAPRRSLRTQLGWGLVELGLHVLPNRHVLSTSSPRAV
ncbi:hypothetical protein [Streptomyces sp. NPDC048411]|uniref:hypothetical protein n=1 Tax=Streptomyces sp. NPDC048411 TaxID=3157206 RepID=UPI00345241C0